MKIIYNFVMASILVLNIIILLMLSEFTVKLDKVQTDITKIKTLVIDADSLYLRIITTQAEHFANCSFILQDSVAVGYQGYLYCKYHRKYKIQTNTSN